MSGTSLRLADLIERDGEPRLLDLRLAEVLGYVTPVSIRVLFRDNRDELERYGPLIMEPIKNTDPLGRGRPGHCFFANEAQALLLCMKAQTPRAADARQEVITVFLAYRHGTLVPATAATDQLLGAIRDEVKAQGVKVDQIAANQHITLDTVVRIERRQEEQQENSRRRFTFPMVQQYLAFAVHDGRKCPVCRDRFVVVVENGVVKKLASHVHHVIRVGSARIEHGMLMCAGPESCHADRHAAVPKIPEQDFLLIFHEYQRRLALFLNSQVPLPFGPLQFGAPRYTDGAMWKPRPDPARVSTNTAQTRIKSKKQLSLDEIETAWKESFR